MPDMKRFPDLLVPAWDAPAGIRAFSTFRSGGVSPAPYHGREHSEGGLNLACHVGDDAACVAENRRLLRDVLPGEPRWLNQVHGTVVLSAEDPAGLPDADACVARRPHDVCVVMTADCLPVLFCDVSGRVVAAAHAGWRGLADGVLENTLAAMRTAGAAEILAWLGPAIGPESFEVGDDVLQAFAGRHPEAGPYFRPVAGRAGKYLADIYALARMILGKNAVTRVSGGGFCTVMDAARFYSYRRDGVTGRMASCIWMARTA